MGEVTLHHLRKTAARDTEEYVFSQLIPYIGNKRKLLDLIHQAIKLTNIEDGTLTIKGNKHGFEEDEDATIVRRELKHSAFERKFTLGDSLDADSVKAKFKDGLLNISIQKIEEVKPKKSFVKIK